MMHRTNSRRKRVVGVSEAASVPQPPVWGCVCIVRARDVVVLVLDRRDEEKRWALLSSDGTSATYYGSISDLAALFRRWLRTVVVEIKVT